MSEATDKEEVTKDESSSQEAPKADNPDLDDVFGGAEPWEPIETKLVLWSFITAAIALAVFGTLINIYLL